MDYAALLQSKLGAGAVAAVGLSDPHLIGPDPVAAEMPCPLGSGQVQHLGYYRLPSPALPVYKQVNHTSMV